MSKKGTLYLWMLALWCALFILLIPVFIHEFSYITWDNSLQSLFIWTLLACNTLFISYFWLNGVKDFTYVAFFYTRRAKLFSQFCEVQNTPPFFLDGDPRVALLYCTCDDFDGASLAQSMKQNYCNIKTVILDDSHQASNRKAIDEFAQSYSKCFDISVVRRADRIGFKAGNLNNFLSSDDDYDYFVILDSDEIIPSDFCEKALQYFAYDPHIGIVQANHIATRNKNHFMEIFHKGVNSHWITYQVMKHHYGFLSLLGHGAMISRACYEDAGGFPHVVSEDLCFSIMARKHGYYVAFAPNITCQEEYPIDYIAFKKRHARWLCANFEYMRSYTHMLMSMNMTWYEKLDVFLFTYNLPLTSLFSLYIAINVMFFPLLSYNLHYPVWMLIPTLVFFVAPMLNDILTYAFKIPAKTLLEYVVWTFLLYGSMLPISIIASFQSLFGKKAVFTVTRKNMDGAYTLTDALRLNKLELSFSLVVILISIFFTHSILPVLLIVVPGASSVFLTMIANAPASPIEAARHKRHTSYFDELVKP